MRFDSLDGDVPQRTARKDLNKDMSRGKEEIQEESKQDYEQRKAGMSNKSNKTTYDEKGVSRKRGGEDSASRRDNKSERSGRRSPVEKDEKCPKCLQVPSQKFGFGTASNLFLFLMPVKIMLT